MPTERSEVSDAPTLRKYDAQFHSVLRGVRDADGFIEDIAQRQRRRRSRIPELPPDEEEEEDEEGEEGEEEDGEGEEGEEEEEDDEEEDEEGEEEEEEEDGEGDRQVHFQTTGRFSDMLKKEDPAEEETTTNVPDEWIEDTRQVALAAERDMLLQELGAMSEERRNALPKDYQNFSTARLRRLMRMIRVNEGWVAQTEARLDNYMTGGMLVSKGLHHWFGLPDTLSNIVVQNIDALRPTIHNEVVMESRMSVRTPMQEKLDWAMHCAQTYVKRSILIGDAENKPRAAPRKRRGALD